MVLREKITRCGVFTPDQLESPEKIIGTFASETAQRIDEKIERQL